MSSVWRHRDFRLLWAGDTVSQFGTYSAHAVLPLLAIGVLAATPFQLGLLEAAATVPFLLIGLQAGAWLDRKRRKPVLVGADLARAGLLLSVPVAAWLDVLTFGHLIVVALLVGVATVFFDVAGQSYIPSLLGRDRLTDGNAKLAASRSVTEMAAPATGGWLVQLAGAANAVLTTGVSYLGSALLLLRLAHREPELTPRPGRRMRTDILEGIRFVLHTPSLRALAGCGATANFFDAILGALIAAFLVREVGLSPGAVGVVLAVGGVGGLLAAVSAGRWFRRFGQIRTLWLVQLCAGPLYLFTPLTQQGWQVGFAFVGYPALIYASVVYDIGQVSYRQAICPEHLLGRMNASMRFVVWGALPLGALAGGALGEWIGVRGALWVASIGSASAVLWVLCSPLRRMREAPAMSGTPDPS